MKWEAIALLFIVVGPLSAFIAHESKSVALGVATLAISLSLLLFLGG